MITERSWYVAGNVGEPSDDDDRGGSTDPLSGLACLNPIPRSRSGPQSAWVVAIELSHGHGEGPSRTGLLSVNERSNMRAMDGRPLCQLIVGTFTVPPLASVERT